ncbi:MAG: hypothetical protein JXN62_09465 [Bacteroidales bacterium]|nr:hypothetical protein [Bacteroidales bacterium]
MRRLTISVICVLVISTIYAKAYSNELDGTPGSPLNENFSAQNNDAVAFQLFPTQNMWTFLKLNTRNGQIWQVQYDVEGDNRFEVYLNFVPLVPVDQQVNGRFTLYPTENVYTFILLDQLDGKMWQVQWSMEAKNRLIVPIK